VLIECPLCSGEGCDQCNDGMFELTQCATQYIDHHLVTAINLAAYADKGLLPTSGGMLDQSAWFFSVWLAIDNDTKKIEADQRRERR
jgi:hypothetical protein